MAALTSQYFSIVFFSAKWMKMAMRPSLLTSIAILCLLVHYLRFTHFYVQWITIVNRVAKTRPVPLLQTVAPLLNPRDHICYQWTPLRATSLLHLGKQQSYIWTLSASSLLKSLLSGPSNLQLTKYNNFFNVYSAALWEGLFICCCLFLLARKLYTLWRSDVIILAVNMLQVFMGTSLLSLPHVCAVWLNKAKYEQK